MSSSTKTLILDFETTSAVDLKVCGVDVYAKHPSTKILCFSYAFDDDPVKTEVLAPRGVIPALPHSILNHIMLDRTVVAHNAAFERAIWNNIVAPFLNMGSAILLTPRQTAQDTMIRAAYWGLPMSLNMVAHALKLPFGKDPVGHRLMLQCSKPRETRPDGSYVWWHETDPSKLAAIADYCAQDVELERVIHDMLPALPAATVEEYVLDAAMNERGLRVDLNRIADLRSISDRAVKILDRDMFAATQGKVKNTRAVSDLTAFVNQFFVKPVTSLDKNAIASILARPILTPIVQTVLQYRRDAAKTSTAKFNSMLKCADAGGIIRWVFQFYGATRTGRYAGRLIQPQNFPRPHMKRQDLEDAYAALKGTGTPGDTLQLMSSMLRSCIIANAPNEQLVVVDFAQIEARVLAWLAGQADILAVFAKGEDVYTYAANRIGSLSRQLGKVMTLGLGYGMGWAKFIETALTYGLTLNEPVSRDTVQRWRKANDQIVKLWYRFDEVIRDLIENRRGVWVKPSHTCDVEAAVLWNDAAGEWCLLIRLPSGRLLVYRDPQVDDEGINYMGLDQYTKQWTRIRSYGAKFIENIVQAIARDLMLWVMLRVYQQFAIVPSGTIHDEGIWSVPKSGAGLFLGEVEKLIEDMPNLEPWMAGLPMKGDGFIADRYGKG